MRFETSGHEALKGADYARIPSVTLLDITFELQKPLSTEQFRRLRDFANTYGLRRFRTAEGGKQLTLEYDASRLKPTEVAHVLGRAGIPIVRHVDPYDAKTS
jgi:hypothetical protein